MYNRETPAKYSTRRSSDVARPGSEKRARRGWWSRTSRGRQNLCLNLRSTPTMQKTYAELSEAAQRAGEAEVIRNDAHKNDDRVRGFMDDRPRPPPVSSSPIRDVAPRSN